MEHKKHTSHNAILVDILITLLCVSGIVLAGTRFHSDLSSLLNRDAALPIGSLTLTYNAVLRRSSDGIVWSRLTPEAPVNNGDLIKTGFLSEAVITFADGSSAGLSENSTVRITAESRVQLELSGGSLIVQSKRTGLVITQGGQTITISGKSAVQAVCGEDGALLLRVLEGRATLLTTDGKTHRVPAGTAMSIASGTTAITPATGVVVLAPLPNSEIYADAFPVPVLFSWTAADGGAQNHIRLDIATDRRFFRIIHTIDAASSGLSVNLDEGTYWWRIYPVPDDSGSEHDPPPTPDVSTGALYIRRAPQ